MKDPVAPDGADHRTRVGRERRERTEARILESAMQVFAEKGPDAPLIDDFVRAAGIARGTFYNYYRSTGELLEAVSHILEDDLIASIVLELETITDPLVRLATGLRLWMAKAESDPAWCSFIVRVRRRAGAVERELGRDLHDAMKSGQVKAPSLALARDLAVGTILEAMGRMTEERVPRSYSGDVVAVILRGLGVDARSIRALLARPLAPARRPTRALAR
jgi:AcrR family transcriptional regulator